MQPLLFAEVVEERPVGSVFKDEIHVFFIFEVEVKFSYMLEVELALNPNFPFKVVN